MSVTPEQSVFEAIEKMAGTMFGALLVISNGNLVAFFQSAINARKGILKGRNSHETTVEEMMSSPVFSVSPQQTVDECMSIMTQNDFRHLPVMQNNVLVGVVSMGDLVRWVISRA